MFIRQKINKSGTVSIQLIDRSRGRYKLVNTIGCSMDPLELDRLLENANAELLRLSQPLNINFDPDKEKGLAGFGYPDVEQIRLAGPELVLGKLYDDIGFGLIKDELFRHMVLARLCYPLSKLKTIDYLLHSKGIAIDAERIHTYLERLGNKQKDRAEELCGSHAKRIRNKAFREAVCYISPLHCEQADAEGLKTYPVAKETKFHPPHLIFILFADKDGDPLAYELVEGNKMSYHTLHSLTEAFAGKHRTRRFTVVADTAAFTEEHPAEVEGAGFEYIFGVRLKGEDHALLRQIKALKLKSRKNGEILLGQERRLLVSYSPEKAEKEKFNRKKGLEKLERAIQSGSLSRKNINYRGYNRYLKPTGKTGIAIDYRKVRRDEKLDGLTTTVTTTKLDGNLVGLQYSKLSCIGNAFRISQTDLQSEYQDHQPMPRIEAHFSIAFAAYKLFRELERGLNSAGIQWSAEQAIQTAKTIQEIIVLDPSSGRRSSHLHLQNEEQRKLLELFG